MVTPAESTSAFLNTEFINYGLGFVGAIITLSLGWMAAKIIKQVTLKVAKRVALDETLGSFLANVAYILIILVVTIAALNELGFHTTSLVAILGAAGLAIALAFKDSISNFASGIVIIIFKPFRVGDRIEIQSINTWGDVVDIGTRTTRIRTRDNRMVIVPNSVIGKSEVINYTYPDTRYRVQIEIGVSFDSDIERVKEIIVESVSKVEGVLLDKPIDALFLEFGDTAMIIRVRWWINSYTDTRRMFDKVNTNLLEALNAEGVDMPFTTYDINIRTVDSIDTQKEQQQS